MAIPENIEQLANDIRTKIYGRDVREALASGIEAAGSIANDADVRSQSTETKQTNLETRFEQQIQNMTLEDPSSAEIVDARGGETVLKNRLDKVDQKYQDVTTQLAQKATKTDVNLRGQYSDILTPVGYTRFVAHRGMSSIAPEGTLPAVILASELGLWSAEGDARLTADGEWIIFHDSTVDRMTNGTGNVSDLTLAQIKDLTIDAGNNIAYYPNLKVPTLKEYLLTCKEHNIVPNIELKSDTYEPTYTSEQYDSFISVIQECGLENKIIVQGSEPLCTQIRNRSKSIVLMLFTGFDSLLTWAGDYIKNSGNMILNTDDSNVTSQTDIEKAHSMGFPVSVFVVDDINRALELQSWGVDFIITNSLSGVKLK